MNSDFHAEFNKENKISQVLIYNSSSKKMTTTADSIKEELMDFCGCGSGLKAIYYCKVKTCPSYAS
jgi:hypothetical protein